MRCFLHETIDKNGTRAQVKATVRAREKPKQNQRAVKFDCEPPTNAPDWCVFKEARRLLRIGGERLHEIFALGTLLLERQQDGSYTLVKPICPPKSSIAIAIAGFMVPDQEVAVQWIQRVRAGLRIPELDDDGIWSDDDSQTTGTTSRNTATHKATPHRHNTKGKGKQVNPIVLSGSSRKHVKQQQSTKARHKHTNTTIEESSSRAGSRKKRKKAKTRVSMMSFYYRPKYQLLTAFSL